MKSHTHQVVPIRSCDLLTQKGKVFRFLWTWKPLCVPRSSASQERFIPEATVSQIRGSCSPREGNKSHDGRVAGSSAQTRQFASRLPRTRRQEFSRDESCVWLEPGADGFNWNVGPFSEQQLSVLWLRQNPEPSKNHPYFVITPLGPCTACAISGCPLQQFFFFTRNAAIMQGSAPAGARRCHHTS